jgi:hypothetical protein
MLCSNDHEKSRNHRPGRLRSDRKLHEPHIRQVAQTPHKMTTKATKTLQRRWHGKQSRRTPILYRPGSLNGKDDHPPTILPNRIGGTQGNFRILLVRSHPTKNRLEEGMDRSLPTPYRTQSPKCSKSSLCLTTQKHPQADLQNPILHWKCDHPSPNL